MKKTMLVDTIFDKPLLEGEKTWEKKTQEQNQKFF